jgi:type I restriction enzyme S subunit
MVEDFKNTDAGIIPNDWNAPVLSEISDFENGKAHEQFIDDKGDYIVVNSKFISQEGRVAKYSKENLSPLSKGSIAIVMSDIPNGKALAKCFYIDKDNRYTLNQRIGSIIPFEEIDSDYLFYKLNRNKYFLSFDSGSGQTNLKKSEILACPVALPPTKDEQTAIATAIKNADALINQLEQLLTKKRNIKTGAMQELLTAKRRLDGYTDDWISEPLPNVCWFQEGPGLRNWQFTKFGIKVINVTNLENGYLNLDRTDRYISLEEFHRMYEHFEIDENDIVVASSGNSYGKVAVVRKQDLPLVMNTSVIRFKPLKNLDYNFLLAFLKSYFFKDQIDLLITGGAQPNFGPAHLRKIYIKLPKTKEEQNAIATILANIDLEIFGLEEKLEKYKMLKQGMMQSLLTGKIRLV